MKVTTSNVVRIQLTELDRLDPITIFLEDFEPRKGKITIECYGQSWSSYWGGMGDRSIAEFFIDCNNSYLAGNLSRISSDVDDYEGLGKKLKKAILEQHANKQIDDDEKDDLLDELEEAQSYLNDDDGMAWCKMDGAILPKVFGDDWWYSIPKKSNHEYQYLCRIIDAVRAGLVEYLKEKSEVPA
ncbi:hypothetical protein NTE19_003349 [Vibrio fluvialis]|nr:hypothetical protein [Vibrio fluvialis]